jgi:hypothetical protein
LLVRSSRNTQAVSRSVFGPSPVHACSPPLPAQKLLPGAAYLTRTAPPSICRRWTAHAWARGLSGGTHRTPSPGWFTIRRRSGRASPRKGAYLQENVRQPPGAQIWLHKGRPTDKRVSGHHEVDFGGGSILQEPLWSATARKTGCRDASAGLNRTGPRDRQLL